MRVVRWSGGYSSLESRVGSLNSRRSHQASSSLGPSTASNVSHLIMVTKSYSFDFRTEREEHLHHTVHRLVAITVGYDV